VCFPFTTTMTVDVLRKESGSPEGVLSSEVIKRYIKEGFNWKHNPELPTSH
jgi:hypothetical protein